MARTITLRSTEYTLGDLTAATLEDFEDACQAFFAIKGDMSDGLTGDNLRAAITLGAEAVRRGSHPDMTREAFRELVQMPDLIQLYVAVGDAMGLDRVKKKGPAPGEAMSPQGSPA